MIEFLIDTNIFIFVLKGNTALKTLIENMVCALDTTIYAELIQGAKNKIEVRKIEKYLKKFDLIHFDENISRRTLELLRTYSKSHGLMFGDAIIAATCLEKDLTLVTFNIKDFRFINDSKIMKP